MMIPAGKYIAQPAPNTEVGRTKNKNTPYVRVKFRVLADDFGDLANKGETVEWTGWLTDKAKPYAEKAMLALGWNGSWDPPVTVDPNYQALIVVEHEEYNGKTYARVRWVNELPLEKYALVGEPKKYGAPGPDESDDLPF